MKNQSLSNTNLLRNLPRGRSIKTCMSKEMYCHFHNLFTSCKRLLLTFCTSSMHVMLTSFLFQAKFLYTILLFHFSSFTQNLARPKAFSGEVDLFIKYLLNNIPDDKVPVKVLPSISGRSNSEATG